MLYKHQGIYKLAYGFEYFQDLRDGRPDVFKEGETFVFDAARKIFVAAKDGAKISAAVAAKMGRQMRKKMFVLV